MKQKIHTTTNGSVHFIDDAGQFFISPNKNGFSAVIVKNDEGANPVSSSAIQIGKDDMLEFMKTMNEEINRAT